MNNKKNDKKRIASLEEKMAEMEEIVNDLTSKDAELQYNIQSFLLKMLVHV